VQDAQGVGGFEEGGRDMALGIDRFEDRAVEGDVGEVCPGNAGDTLHWFQHAGGGGISGSSCQSMCMVLSAIVDRPLRTCTAR